MADSTHNLYEGMFLVAQGAVAADAANGIEIVKQILDRAEAEPVTLCRWDERKLAFPVEGQKRGTFYRTLFRVAGHQIAHIERDCNLSEDILRMMVLRAEHIGEVELAAEIEEAKNAHTKMKLDAEAAPEQAEEAPAEEAAQEPAAEVEAAAE